MAGGKKGGQQESKKTEQKKKEKIIDDKTFGLKNKNKSKTVQSFVKAVSTQVLNQHLKVLINIHCMWCVYPILSFCAAYCLYPNTKMTISDSTLQIYNAI